MCASIRPGWSESLQCTQWVAKDPSFLHADSKDSDQTGWMPRLFWVLLGTQVVLLVLTWGGSNVCNNFQVNEFLIQLVTSYHITKSIFSLYLPFYSLLHVCNHVRLEISLHIKRFPQISHLYVSLQYGFSRLTSEILNIFTISHFCMCVIMWDLRFPFTLKDFPQISHL